MDQAWAYVIGTLIGSFVGSYMALVVRDIRDGYNGKSR